MAEAFVKTFKRDCVSANSIPDAKTVIAQLPLWFEHYNTLHPHKALRYRSPREFLNRQTESDPVRFLWATPQQKEAYPQEFATTSCKMKQTI
jgi:transposase InsO family protein